MARRPSRYRRVEVDSDDEVADEPESVVYSNHGPDHLRPVGPQSGMATGRRVRTAPVRTAPVTQDHRPAATGSKFPPKGTAGKGAGANATSSGTSKDAEPSLWEPGCSSCRGYKKKVVECRASIGDKKCQNCIKIRRKCDLLENPAQHILPAIPQPVSAPPKAPRPRPVVPSATNRRAPPGLSDSPSPEPEQAAIRPQPTGRPTLSLPRNPKSSAAGNNSRVVTVRPIASSSYTLRTAETRPTRAITVPVPQAAAVASSLGDRRRALSPEFPDERPVKRAKPASATPKPTRVAASASAAGSFNMTARTAAAPSAGANDPVKEEEEIDDEIMVVEPDGTEVLPLVSHQERTVGLTMEELRLRLKGTIRPSDFERVENAILSARNRMEGAFR